MTTRRTLKDFLVYSGNANVDKLSYDINNPESGAKEIVEEGDDLGTDPNTGKLLLGSQGMLGNYLKYTVDNSSNIHKFKEGNEEMSPTNRGNYLQEAHDHGVESTFVDQSSHLYNDIQNYSNSKMMDDASGLSITNDLDKVGQSLEGTGQILKEVEGTALSQTNQVLIDSNGNTIAQNLSYQLLKNNNRFVPVNKDGAYKDNNKSDQQFESSENIDTVSRVHGTQTMSNNFGSYNKNEIDGKLSLNQLKGLGASILLRAGGWDLESTPAMGIDTSLGNNELLKSDIKSIAEDKNTVDNTDNLKIGLNTVRSKNAYTAPADSASGNSVREGRGEYAGRRSTGQSSLYNTEFNFAGRNSKYIKYQAAAALLAIYKLFEEQIGTLEQYADGQALIGDKLKITKFYSGAGPYTFGSSKTSGQNILDFVKKNILVQTKYSYGDCFRIGMKILFGIENSSMSSKEIADNSTKNFLDDSPGYWQSVSYSVVRRYKSFIDDMSITSDPIHNFNSFITILRDNAILQFMNVIATIGDIRLQATSGEEKLEDALLPIDVDVLEDTPQNRKKKGRKLRGYTRLERSTSQRSVPSMYLLPGNVVKAVADMGTAFSGDNPTKGMLGSSLASKTYIDRNLTKSYNKIPIEVARKLEDKLEGEYVPFYIQDLRTNEIIAFHAFLTDLTDNIQPTFDQKTGYGRLDPVQIYNKTTRSVTVGFTLIATSKEDFDEMWYKINKITTLLYPQWTQGTKLSHVDGAKFVQPFSQVIGASPIVRLRVGDVIKSNYSKFNLARIHGLGDEETVLKKIADDSSIGGAISNLKQGVNEVVGSFNKAVFELFYSLAGSPLQYKASADGKGKIIQAAASAAGDIVGSALENGFVNPLVVTQLLNVMKDPDLHEQTGLLSGKSFGYKAESDSRRSSLASSAYLRANPHKGYVYQGKLVKTNFKYKVKIVKVLSPDKVPNSHQSISNSANKTLTNTNGDNFNVTGINKYNKNRTMYRVRVIDASAPAALMKESLDVYHSDLIPDYNNIYNRRVAPLIAATNPLEAAGEAIKGAAKNLASKVGIGGDAVDGMLNDTLGSEPAKFMDASNNPITRAFESSMGRGLAGVLGNIQFKWLEDNIPWEIDFNSRAPIGCNISFSLSVIHDLPPGLSHDGYNRAPLYNVGDIMRHVSGDPNESIESAEFSYKGGENIINKKLKR
jgi:hypothetical protein